MSIRKRKWTTSKGIEKEAWIVDYLDGKGIRRLKTFDQKKKASDFAATARIEVKEGTHIADSVSVTVEQAAKFWLASAEANELERATILQYRQHVDLHITPFIGATKLSALNVPTVRAFEDKLRQEGRSASMIRKVRVSLGSMIADAQERGLVARNVVRELRSKRKGKGDRQEKRHKGRLKVGVDVPSNEEVRAIVGALDGRWRPVLLTAIFTGLRASELRGLHWRDVDFDKRELHVRQRADRYNQIGSPKSEAGERCVPLPPLVLNTLREWKLRSHGGELVFPNGKGNVESLGNIVKRGLQPAQVKAGVTDENGKAKYPGMHALRHWYASWLINPPERGGLGLDFKVAQERLGHSSIVLTVDTYAHSFGRGDSGDAMAEAERALLA